MSLIHLVAAEWRKVSTTKLLWIMVLAALAYCALNVTLLILVAPGASTQLADLDPLQSPDYITSVLASAGNASVFVLLLGIIGMTSEYRHMTITSTFLAAPRRGRVIVAKGLLYAVLGAAIAIVAAAFTTLLTVVLLAGKPHAPVEPGSVLAVAAGVLLGLAIYAVLGVSVGALIKNQVAAIVIAIIFVLLVEPLLSVFVSGIAKWLPGAALNSAMSVTTQQDLTAADLLPVWGGAVVLLAYAVVFGAIASVTTVRRDIT